MAPDTQIGHHVHPLDYLVVMLTAGTLTIVDSNGEQDFPLDAGVSIYGETGDAHDVLNRGEAEIVFLEIEIK